MRSGITQDEFVTICMHMYHDRVYRRDAIYTEVQTTPTFCFLMSCLIVFHVASVFACVIVNWFYPS